MLYEPRKTEIVTFVGLGMSMYDWVAYSYRNFTPEDNQVWTINTGVKLFNHDVCFDIHVEDWLVKQAPKNPVPLARRIWMQKHNKPIVLARQDPLIPTSLTYPLKRVIEETHSAYFSTGMAYMFACVWIIKPKVLRLFGCDFTYDRNHNTHDEPGRACCEYWVGRIIERGTKVETTNNTHFLDMRYRSEGNLYGYSEKATYEFDTDANGRPVGEGRFVGPDYSKPGEERKVC